MIDKLSSEGELAIDSIIVSDRTRKDFGGIDSLAESKLFITAEDGTMSMIFVVIWIFKIHSFSIE